VRTFVNGQPQQPQQQQEPCFPKEAVMAEECMPEVGRGAAANPRAETRCRCLARATVEDELGRLSRLPFSQMGPRTGGHTAPLSTLLCPGRHPPSLYLATVLPPRQPSTRMPVRWRRWQCVGRSILRIPGLFPPLSHFLSPSIPFFL
jgi:hypothetical protein